MMIIPVSVHRHRVHNQPAVVNTLSFRVHISVNSEVYLLSN